MKTIREQFEEIWPVPFGVSWNVENGKYMVFGMSCFESSFAAHAHNARLDTFARCQESQAIVTSLNDELVETLKLCNTQLCNLLYSAEYLSDDQFKAIELAGITLAKVRGKK